MEVKIKDGKEAKLFEVLRIFSWVDAQRWKNVDYLFNSSKGEGVRELSNAEKILTHWIVYIFNMMTKTEYIWDAGAWVCSDIVRAFGDGMTIADIRYHFYSQPPKLIPITPHPKIKAFGNIVLSNWVENMFRTFEILDRPEYHRNFIEFIKHFLLKYEKRNDALSRIGCALQILTYDIGASSEMLEDDTQLDIYFEEFKKDPIERNKRLWCCLRDYKVVGQFNQIFCDALKEIKRPAEDDRIIRLWNQLPLTQLELPTDRWTKDPIFKEKFMANLIVFPPQKKITTSHILRAIFTKYEERIQDFYPAQMDVLVDFTQRMCAKGDCNLCLFGEDGGKVLCHPSEGEKLCPVLAYCFGYRIFCQGAEKCHIYNMQGMDACVMLEKGKRKKLLP